MKKEKLFMLILVIVLVFGGAYKLYDELTKDNTVEVAGAETQAVPAKDITVYNKDGEEVKLSDYIGKPIVMNFWASWCTPCQIEMPEFQKMYETYGEDVEFLMINMTASGGETVDRAHAFVENGGYTFPVFYDTEHDAAATYGASTLPTTFFINAEGYVTGQFVGTINAEQLEIGIQSIFDEEKAV